MFTQNREFYSFKPGINLNISLAWNVNALSERCIVGIYVPNGTLSFDKLGIGVGICRSYPTKTNIEDTFDQVSLAGLLYLLRIQVVNGNLFKWTGIYLKDRQMTVVVGRRRSIVDWSIVKSTLRVKNKSEICQSAFSVRPCLCCQTTIVYSRLCLHVNIFAETACKQCCSWLERQISWRQRHMWPKINTGMIWLLFQYSRLWCTHDSAYMWTNAIFCRNGM